MKLGYLISQYPAVNHTYVLREVLALRRAGLNLCAVSIRRSDRPVEKLSADEADEHKRTFSVFGAGLAHAVRANLRTLLRRPVSYLRGLWHALRLTRGAPRLLPAYIAYFLEAVVAGDYFDRAGVEFVHTHFSSTVLLILARIFPVRYSMTLHGSAEFADVVGFHVAEKVAGAEFIATISNYGASQVMAASDPKHWRKVRALPLGVDPQAFSPRIAVREFGRSPFRLVSVGSLVPAKAFHMLIEAVRLLHQRGRSVMLTLVGEGPSRQSMEKLIADLGLGEQVKLVGACNHDKVAEFYGNSDAFVLASFAEGVPVVLMEAMAMELPCVATWITGIPELITDGVEGLLVPPADPVALADAVEFLMRDPDLARRIGAAGRAKILASYHLEKNSKALGVSFSEYLRDFPNAKNCEVSAFEGRSIYSSIRKSGTAQITKEGVS